MSREDLIEFCRALYTQSGIEALSYPSLRKHKALYATLYRVGLPQKELIAALGLEGEYRTYKESLPLKRQGGRISQRWTWNRCVAEAKAVQDQHSHLPPAAWFQANGQGSLVQAVYYLGQSWELLREALGDFQNSSFVESRNGMRWRSHPEASLSNFLYARGIEHKRGEKYPENYGKHSTAKYAYYDVHFRPSGGEWVDVEIWGDKPHGHGEERYGEKRKHKEAYHSGRKNFIGIHFNDCFSDEKLSIILAPFIGNIQPFIFDKPTDHLIESSHWSNADELLESCSQLAKQMPDGKFPTEEWLRKRGKWAGRPGKPLNTMSVYIKLWLGGVRNVRKLLGQNHHSTEAWSRESAISAYKAFFDKFGMTPDQCRSLRRSGDPSLPSDLSKRAANICFAVRKYAGGTAAVNQELGISIDRTRKWSRETVLNGYREIIEKWEITPSQLLNDHRTGKIKLEENVASSLSRLVGVTKKHFASLEEIWHILDFKPPSRPRKCRPRKIIL